MDKGKSVDESGIMKISSILRINVGSYMVVNWTTLPFKVGYLFHGTQVKFFNL